MKKLFSLFFVSLLTISAMAWDALYIVGDGTSVGWVVANAKAMNKISNKEFEITDYFYNGQMKILCQQDWGAAYGPAHNEYSTLSEDGKESFNQLVRNTVYTAQGFNMGETTYYNDYKFGTTAGWYTIHINTETNQISTYPRYIYPIGDGCEVGWNKEDITKAFKETSFGSGIYTGSVRLIPGNDKTFKFNCQTDWGVQFGPVTGGTNLAACGVYDVNFSDGSQDRKWNVSIEEKNYHIAVDVKNGKMYVQPEQVTFKMHASEAAKQAMENEVGFYWWNAAGSGDWTVSESDGWYTAIVTNAYMPINYLWHGKDWNSKTGNQTNFDQGFVQDQTVIAAYNGATIDTDKRQIELWYEDTYSTYGAFTLAASAEHVAPGTEVIFTPAIADYAGTPEYTYYINGVEATLTNNKYTFANQGFYRVEAVTTIDHQIIKATKEIFVENTLTFKVHVTNALKAAWDNSLYLYYWSYYDGYDHASIIQLTDEEEGWYTVDIAAVAPVKFLLKNTEDGWDKQTVNLTNDEAGFSEGFCMEITSAVKSEGKYEIHTLPTCEFTTYELTLEADKTTVAEGGTVTFTPAVSNYEGAVSYTYYINNVETTLTENIWTPTTWGKYTIKVTAEVEGTPLESTTAVTVTRDIKISAHINEAAMAILGTAKCNIWWDGGSEARDMTPNGDVYETTFAAVSPIKFLIYNGEWVGYGGEQTVDMTNTVTEGEEQVEKGYDADRLVHVVEIKNNNGKLGCYHIDAVNTNKVTVNLYAEDAEWADAYFLTQNVALETGYQNVFVHPTKGADNWYTYTYEGVDAIDWVATATTDNWDNRVNDVAGLSAEKFLYVMTDKHGNGHHKMADMGSKTLPKTLTFEFKFDGAAHTSWGDENPVGLYYWQNYSEDCAAATDHAAGIEMNKNEDNVYTATVKAFNNVKFVVQSDLEHGFQGEGHYTVEATAGERTTGFAENKKFWIRDNGTAHYLELTDNFDFTPAEMTVPLNKDGFASLYWDKNYKLTGADAYVGHVTYNTVVLTKIDGNGIIPAKSAVILYGTPNGEATATETLDASTGYDYSNAFRGSITPLENMSNVYVLAQTEDANSTAFYYLDSEHAMTIPAYRAYLSGTVGNGAPLRIRFATNTTTGLENANANVNVNKVLRNGRVYIVRDNKVYTVMGQFVNE